jgi:hypothetical protein
MGSTRQIFNSTITIIGVTACACAYFWLHSPPGVAPRLAWICSLLSLTLSLTSWDPFRAPANSIADSSRDSVAWRMIRHLALYLGVVAGMIQIVLITMRSVYVGIDLMHGYLWQGARDYGFGQTGLWTIAALSAACGLGWFALRDGRLLTLQFWILVLLALWACLLCDPFCATRTGGFERTDATLVLAECLACLILIAVILVGWVAESRFLSIPTGERLASVSSSVHAGQIPPGFRSSVTVVALALNVAVMFHILVPSGQAHRLCNVWSAVDWVWLPQPAACFCCDEVGVPIWRTRAWVSSP